MPIGNKNRNGNSDKKMIFVNAIVKDEKKLPIKPYFSFKENTGESGGKKVYTEIAKDTSFSGNLIKVEPYKKTIKNNNIEQPFVKVLFEDDDSIYFLDMGYTILSRSFFNCLLSLESLEGININLYQTKPNDKGQVFPQISVWQGDKMIRWLYAKEDLPAIKKVKIKGAEMSDTEDVDNFFREKLEQKFANIAITPSAGKPKAKKAPSSPVNDEQSDDASPPF